MTIDVNELADIAEGEESWLIGAEDCYSVNEAVLTRFATLVLEEAAKACEAQGAVYDVSAGLCAIRIRMMKP